MFIWAVGALAQGLGIRAVARVFEVDPNTVLQWLVAAADHLKAFSQYFLHDVHVTQVKLDELSALLSAIKAGEVSEAMAMEHLSRSPHWVWTALDPVSKLWLTIDVETAHWRWRNMWSIRSSRSWRQVAGRCFSPMASRSIPRRC
jgi:hypothetical protein